MIRLPRAAQEPQWFQPFRQALEWVLQRFAPLPVSYTVAALPVAADHALTIVHVSDEAGGPTLAYSDGSDWLRVTDNAIVS